jgi:hypothetical protein
VVCESDFGIHGDWGWCSLKLAIKVVTLLYMLTSPIGLAAMQRLRRFLSLSQREESLIESVSDSGTVTAPQRAVMLRLIRLPKNKLVEKPRDVTMS